MNRERSIEDNGNYFFSKAMQKVYDKIKNASPEGKRDLISEHSCQLLKDALCKEGKGNPYNRIHDDLQSKMQDATEREILAVTQEIHEVVQNIYADISLFQEAQKDHKNEELRAKRMEMCQVERERLSSTKKSLEEIGMSFDT
jgi:hypothetical protein